LFFAGIAAGEDAIDLQGLIVSERRNQLALAVVHVELPAMVGALQIFSVELSAIQGHAAMGAGIAQSEGVSLAVAADDEWDLEQRRFVQLITVDTIRGQSAIPEAGEH